jgi:hypothetical protein
MIAKDLLPYSQQLNTQPHFSQIDAVHILIPNEKQTHIHKYTFTNKQRNKQQTSKETHRQTTNKETYRHKHKYTPTHMQLLNQAHKLANKHPNNIQRNNTVSNS